MAEPTVDHQKITLALAVVILVSLLTVAVRGAWWASAWNTKLDNIAQCGQDNANQIKNHEQRLRVVEFKNGIAPVAAKGEP